MQPVNLRGNQLVEAVVGVGRGVGRGGLGQGVAVGVVGIGSCDGFTVFGLGFRQQAVVGVVGVARDIVLCSRDRHPGAVARRVVAVAHRQAIGFALLRQSAQTVIDITGNFAGMIGFGLLTSRGVVGVAERGKRLFALFVFQGYNPVCLVVVVGFFHPVGIGQTGPVAVDVVGVAGLQNSILAHRRQPVQVVVRVSDILHDLAVFRQDKARPVPRQIVGVRLGVGNQRVLRACGQGHDSRCARAGNNGFIGVRIGKLIQGIPYRVKSHSTALLRGQIPNHAARVIPLSCVFAGSPAPEYIASLGEGAGRQRDVGKMGFVLSYL